MGSLKQLRQLGLQCYISLYYLTRQTFSKNVVGKQNATEKKIIIKKKQANTVKWKVFGFVFVFLMLKGNRQSLRIIV